MKYTIFIFVLVLLNLTELFSLEFSYDNGNPAGNLWTSGKNGWEESVLFVPDGPCNVTKLKIYMYGPNPVKDTIHIVGFPTAGNLYPTEYIWSYNSLVDPVVIDYDGTEGWKEFDISNLGLRSDGIDKIVIQHNLKPNGPWFGYDSDNRKGPLSWYTDPITPNPNFYNIEGTLHYLAPGDFMVRLELTYLYPEGNTSKPSTQPSLVQIPFGVGGENTVADIDNDGWDDVILGGTIFLNGYLNNSNFVKSSQNLSASGTNWIDFDNDGNSNVYAFKNGTYDWDKRMVQNQDKVYTYTQASGPTEITNSKVFLLPYPNPADDFKLGTGEKNETIPNPYNTCTPFWLDYDCDGWPDLFIANKRIEISGKPEIYCPDEIWKNNGDGTFSNTRVSSNISSGEPYTNVNASQSGGYYDCYGAAAADYNNDMKPDIFVANYRLAPDNLYRNNGDGTFTDVGAETGVRGVPTIAPGYFGHGMGSSWGDFNNDGLIDLCVGNLAHTDSRGLYSNPSLIFRNKKVGDTYTFDEVHNEMGLKFHEGNAGACWADFDNDGYLDLWHGKYSGGQGTFYINQGPPDYKLKDITWEANCFIDNPWEGVRLDFDNDGDEDMVIKGILVRNDLVRKGNWVSFKLEGDIKEGVSTDALGSKVVVYAGGRAFYRELMGTGAGTHSNQNSNQLHFGIGNAEIIDSVVITYANMKQNVLHNVVPNVQYKVKYIEKESYEFFATPAQISPRNFTTQNPANLDLKWEKCGFVHKYQVQVSESANFATTVIDEIVNENTSLNVDLTSGKSYYWRVQAVDSNAGDWIYHGAWSSVWNFVVGSPSYNKLQLIEPANNATGIGSAIKFSWSKASFDNLNFSPDTYYRIAIMNLDNVIYEQEFIRDTTITLYNITEADTEYEWHIAPVVEGVQGEWTDFFKFTTLGLPAQLNLIEPVDGTVDFDVRGTLNWSTAENTDNYWVQISTSDKFENPEFDRKNASKPPLKIFPKLEEGTKYFWSVAGMNNAGEGPWTNFWSFTTAGDNSVAEENGVLWNVFPNPANESLKIEIANEDGNLNITNLFLTDLSGKTVLDLSAAPVIGTDVTLEIVTRYIPSGTYFLKVLFDEKSSIYQVKIQH